MHETDLCDGTIGGSHAAEESAVTSYKEK
jgi:hypothetical protein